MNITELFDKQAELFRRDTGYIAPGKDISPAEGGYSVQQDCERMSLWNAWHKGFLRGMELKDTK